MSNSSTCVGITSTQCFTSYVKAHMVTAIYTVVSFIALIFCVISPQYSIFRNPSPANFLWFIFFSFGSAAFFLDYFHVNTK